MKITDDVRAYAKAQGLAEEQALAEGLRAKTKEFTSGGGEIYR
jgi:phosphomethylpyrimidine synthase